MITPELRHRATTLAKGLLARDWPHDPCYTLFTSDLPTDAGRTVRGLCSVRSLTFRGAIGADWQGPGRVLLLNDTSMAAKQTEGLTRRTFAADVLGVLVHEAAHAVLAPLPEVTEDELLAADLCAAIGRDLPSGSAASVAASLAGLAVDELPPLAERQIDHCANWHRAVAHLHYRAFHHHGELLAPDDVGYAAPLYSTTPANEFLAALLPECRARAAEPIRDIVASPMPPAFAELWERDAALEVEAVQ